MAYIILLWFLKLHFHTIIYQLFYFIYIVGRKTVAHDIPIISIAKYAQLLYALYTQLKTFSIDLIHMCGALYVAGPDHSSIQQPHYQ